MRSSFLFVQRMRWSGQRTCVPKSRTTKRNGWTFPSEWKFLFALWSYRVALVSFQEMFRDKIRQRTCMNWESLGSNMNDSTINCRCFESYMLSHTSVCDVLCPELLSCAPSLKTFIQWRVFVIQKTIYYEILAVCVWFVWLASLLGTFRHCSELSVVHGLIIPFLSFSVKRLTNNSSWCVRSF